MKPTDTSPAVSPLSSTWSRLRVGVAIVATAALLVGGWLLCADLSLIGLTHDEFTDLTISRTFAATFNVFANLNDPSQGRFAHMLAGGAMRVFGESHVVYKAPSVLITFASAALVFFALRRRDKVAALVAAAGFLSNGYVLGAGRTAVTGGDAAVLASWLLAVVASARWSPRDGGAFFPYGLITGAALGLAIGSKWNSVVLLGLPLLRRPRPVQLAPVLAVAVLVALAANPLFLLGPAFLAEAWQSLAKWDAEPTYQFFGSWSSGPPLIYPCILLAVKLTMPVLALAIYGAIRHRRDPLTAAAVYAIAVTLPFGFKNFQNAHYYIGAAGPVFLLLGLAASRQSRTLLAAVVAICISLALSWRVRPDFLQLGSEWGAVMQGEFNGPAVNHCQGAPLAQGDVAALGLARAYRIIECGHWPIPELPAEPESPYAVIVPAVVPFGAKSPAEAEARAARVQEAIAPCDLVVTRPQYKIYRCQ